MIHRADFIALLVSSAKKIPNITVKTNSRVIEYDCDAPKVKTEDGTWYSGDLVVAADGNMDAYFEALLQLLIIFRHQKLREGDHHRLDI